MSSLKSLLLAVFSMGAATADTGPIWTPVNNGLTASPVAIESVVPDPINPSVAYAFTTGGAIYKTTDATATWSQVRGLALVNSLAIDPTDSNTLYAATSQGVFKSTDGGANWAGASAGLDLNSLSIGDINIDPLNPSTIYALGNGGTRSLLKSTDGAATWAAVYTFTNPNVTGQLTIDHSTPSTLYLPMAGGAIFKSADGGVSWSQFKSAAWAVGFAPDAMALAVDPDNSATIYAGSFDNPLPAVFPNSPGAGAIIKSTDGGGTWSIISAGIPADAWVRSLRVDPANSSTLYAAYVSNNGAGLLKSADFGESWSVIYTISNDSLNSYSVMAAIGPATLYAGYSGASTAGLLRSVDGGLTWNPVETGLERFDFNVLAVSPSNPGVLYLGGAGGLYQRAGGAWSSLSLPAIPVDAQYQIASSPALVRSLAIDFTNPDVLYVNSGRSNGGCVIDDKALLKTTDGGATWSNSISPPSSGCLLGGYVTSAPTPVLVMDPRDPQSLYVAEGEDEDGGYVLLKSADGGANWNDIWDYNNGLESGINALVIDPANPGTLYAGLGDAFAFGPSPAAIGFFKSADGGATWTNTGLTNAAVIVLAIDPTNSSTLYAVTQGIYTKPEGFRGMFKSTDAGVTWSPINNGLDRLAQVGATIVSLAIDPINPSTLYAATSGDGVYKTSDGGATWASLNDGLPTFDIRAVAIAPDGVYAATAAGVFRFTARGPAVGGGDFLRFHHY